MAKGKFSNPRPYREEERQIEEAFLNASDKPSEYTPSFQTPSMPPLEPVPQEETSLLPELDAEDAPIFQEEPAPSEEPPLFPEDDADFLSDDLFSEEESGLYQSEEPAEPEKDPVGGVLAFVEAHRKPLLVGVCALALVLIVTFIAIFFLGSGGDPYNGKILSNVVLGNVNVGGLTKSQAIQVVQSSLAEEYLTLDMTVRVGTNTLTLTADDTGAELDVKAAVNAAYSYGRNGTKAEKQAAYQASFTETRTIALLPYLSLNTGYIQSALEDYANTVGSALTQPSYAVEGNIPDLRSNNFDPETAQPLVLVVTMGTPGLDFKKDGLFNAILDAYSLGQFQVNWESADPQTLPDTPDMAEILEKYGKEPVDDSVDLQTFNTVPGSYGYGFDVEEAQRMVDEAQYGQILRIEMTYLAPERMGEDAFYADVLGQYKTIYSANENRVNNLTLACQALDGLTLNPGETFSFNAATGTRSGENGYTTALGYVGTGTANILGGGVSQVSSTVYCAALTADLEILERHAHGVSPSFIDMGLDADVGTTADLRFRNNTNFPIRISAKAEGGFLTVEILGTQEKDYTITLSTTVTNTYEPETQYRELPEDNDEDLEDGDVVQPGVTGYAVRSFQNKYDRETGALISKDFVTSTVYKSVDKIVVKILPAETEPPKPDPDDSKDDTDDKDDADNKDNKDDNETDSSENNGGTGGGDGAGNTPVGNGDQGGNDGTGGQDSNPGGNGGNPDGGGDGNDNKSSQNGSNDDDLNVEE